MAVLRAFPVLHARDVEVVADFYVALGFSQSFRLNAEDGRAGYIGLRRDGGAEMAVTTLDAPRSLAGFEPGPQPRHEMFIYVEDVDAVVEQLRSAGATVLREPADMFWGERVAYVADPEGNLVSLANPPG